MRFQPGNQFGRRWQPGESGNPAGRPPKQPLKAALLAHLDDEPDLAKRLVRAGIERALAGDFRYWKELFDRLDGKVPPAEPESEFDDLIDYADMPEIEPESLA